MRGDGAQELITPGDRHSLASPGEPAHLQIGE
jgi:hypothetical protein